MTQVKGLILRIIPIYVDNQSKHIEIFYFIFQ